MGGRPFDAKFLITELHSGIHRETQHFLYPLIIGPGHRKKNKRPSCKMRKAFYLKSSAALHRQLFVAETFGLCFVETLLLVLFVF